MNRRGNTVKKQSPRRSLGNSSGSNRSWSVIVLAGCSCLWIIFLVISWENSYVDLRSEDDLWKKDSPSLLASAPSLRAPRLSPPHALGDSTKTTFEKTTTTTKEEIRALFDRWNEALVNGDPGTVADLYYYHQNDKSSNGATTTSTTTNATTTIHNQQPPSQSILLLPTMSNEPRTDRPSVEDYFSTFMKGKPRGRIVSGQILIGPDGSWAHDAGIYEFAMAVSPPKSSQQNGSDGSTEPSTSNNTNDQYPAGVALASQNEDTNRTSIAADGVLEGGKTETAQPEGKPSIVRARYSFLYLRDERGEWKIAHHHSSKMPEDD